MDKKHRERLKDIIIDYIYDYCFAEKVRAMEGGGHQMTCDVDQEFDKEFPIYKMIVGSENASYKYGARGVEYCKLMNETDNDKFSIL